MFARSSQQNRDFWSRRRCDEDLDLEAISMTEDILPGSGPGWKLLWEDSVEVLDDPKWAAFLGGDVSHKREVVWLLSP